MINFKLTNQALSTVRAAVKKDLSHLREHQFKKGQSGNPRGGSLIDPKIKAFRETTYEDFIENLKYYGSLTKQQMQEDLTRADTTMFEHIFGTMVIQASDGDDKARNELLSRLWGKPKENIDMAQLMNARLALMSNDELIKLAMEHVKQLKGAPDGNTPNE